MKLFYYLLLTFLLFACADNKKVNIKKSTFNHIDSLVSAKIISEEFEDAIATSDSLIKKGKEINDEPLFLLGKICRFKTLSSKIVCNDSLLAKFDQDSLLFKKYPEFEFEYYYLKFNYFIQFDMINGVICIDKALALKDKLANERQLIKSNYLELYNQSLVSIPDSTITNIATIESKFNELETMVSKYGVDPLTKVNYLSNHLKFYYNYYKGSNKYTYGLSDKILKIKPIPFAEVLDRKIDEAYDMFPEDSIESKRMHYNYYKLTQKTKNNRLKNAVLLNYLDFICQYPDSLEVASKIAKQIVTDPSFYKGNKIGANRILMDYYYQENKIDSMLYYANKEFIEERYQLKYEERINSFIEARSIEKLNKINNEALKVRNFINYLFAIFILFITIFFIAFYQYKKKREDELIFYNKQLEFSNKKIDLSNKLLNNYNQIVSHDLRAPTHSIMSLAQILKENITDPLDGSLESIEMIIKLCENSNQIHNSMLNDVEYLNYINQDFEIVDLNKVIESVEINLNAQIKEANPILSIDNLPQVYGNYNLILIVFQNLVQNAIKFNMPGKNLPEISIYEEIGKNKEFITIVIEDKGIGIEEKDIPLIFDKNYKKNSNSFGLGIFTSKLMMNLMGGDIFCESKVNQYTKMILTFKKNI